MSGYDNFLLRTTLDGANSRESKINDAKHILSIEFKNDPSYQDSMYKWIPGVSPHKGDKIDIRLFGKKYSSANGYTTQFEIQIYDTPDIGDYYYDEKLNQYWICTEIFEINHIYYGGKLTLCNWTLKWQRENGDILEYPCQDINSTQYNSGEAGNQNITLGSAQHMATVQATEDTIRIKSPQRFFVSRDYSIPFRVTQNDTVSSYYGNGLCKITLTQDQLNLKVDRPDIGICDYIEERPDQNVDLDESNDIFAEIFGDPVIKNGFSRKYEVKFKDKKNHPLENIAFTWAVESEFEVLHTDDNNFTTLYIDDETCIGKSFLLQIIINETVKSEMKIMVVEAF